MRMFCLFLSAFCALALSGAELFQNPAFRNPVNAEPVAARLREFGVNADFKELPRGWTVSANGVRLPAASVGCRPDRKERMAIPLDTAGRGALFLYASARIPVRSLQGKMWKLRLGAFGEGTATPVFFGYDSAGKCIFLKQLAPVRLRKDALPDWSLLEPEPLLAGAVSVAAGFAVKGKAICYSAEFTDATPEETQALKAAAMEAAEAGVLQNGSFESPDGWELRLHDGAKGRMERVAGARSGSFSLKLVKENGDGFLQLVARKPVSVLGGEKYVFRGFFQSRAARLDSLLLFRLTATPDERTFAYDAVDSSFGFPSQSLLVNSDPGSWRKRLVSHRPVKDAAVYANVLFSGGSGEVLLDDLTVGADDFQRGAPADLVKRTEFPFSHDDVLAALAARQPEEAYVDAGNGATSLRLNGKPVVPALYKSEWFHSDYVYNRYREFGEAEVPFVLRTVQLSAGKTDAGIVLGPGRYDFKRLEEVLDYALRQNPQARLVIDYGMNEPYPGWGAANPSELWRNEKGAFGWGTWGNCEGFVTDLSQVRQSGARANWFVWPFGSYSSEDYQAAHCRSLKEITEYLMRSPYGKAIVGFHIGGGHDAQFQYFRPDFSEPAMRSFRQFLRRRYPSIGELNRRCGTSFASFDQVGVPARNYTEQGGKPFVNDLRADYKAFQREEAWRLKHRLARAVRSAAGKRVFISSYGAPLEYHAETFCRDRDGVDLFVVPSWYPFRQPGYPVGAKPDATFRMHGKLWLNEMDLRTWTEPAKSELYDMWVGSATDLPLWKSVHRKFAGIALAHRSAWWYYSMYRYFDRPEVMAEIKAAMNAARRVAAEPENPFRPDVCVVRDEDGDDILSATFSCDANTVIFPWQMQQFEISGVPYDLHSLSDVVSRKELQDYKMYLFLHTGRMSAAERAAVAGLKKAGRTLVFVYNSGYLDAENGANPIYMKELTGFEIATSDRFGRASSRLSATHPLGRGISPVCSGGEVLQNMLTLRGVSPHYARYQVFRPATDAEGEVVARYTDGTPAIVCREADGMRTVYAAPPFAVNAELFHRLAELSGAFVAGKPGQSMAMNGNFLSFHGVTPGRYTVKFPPGVTGAVDLFSGREVAKMATEMTLDVKVGESSWFLLTR